MEYITIEGTSTWNGNRFYVQRGDIRPGEWFTERAKEAQKFSEEPAARIVCELLAALSKKIPFIGYEELEIVEHFTDSQNLTECKRVIGKFALTYYRAP